VRWDQTNSLGHWSTKRWIQRSLFSSRSFHIIIQYYIYIYIHTYISEERIEIKNCPLFFFQGVDLSNSRPQKLWIKPCNSMALRSKDVLSASIMLRTDHKENNFKLFESNQYITAQFSMLNTTLSEQKLFSTFVVVLSSLRIFS
jgi:hypothetical protein